MHSNILSSPSSPPPRPSSDPEDLLSAEDPAYLPVPASVAQEAPTRRRSNALSLGLGTTPFRLPPGLAPTLPPATPPGLTLLPPAVPAAALPGPLAHAFSLAAVEAREEAVEFADRAATAAAAAAAHAVREMKRRARSPPSEFNPAMRQRAVARARTTTQLVGFDAVLAAANPPPPLFPLPVPPPAPGTPIVARPPPSTANQVGFETPVPSTVLTPPVRRRRAIYAESQQHAEEVARLLALLPNQEMFDYAMSWEVDEEPEASEPTTLFEQLTTRHGVINVARPVEMEWTPTPPVAPTAPQPAQGAVAMEVDREGPSEEAVDAIEVDGSETESDISSITSDEIMEAHASMDEDTLMAASPVFAAAAPPAASAVVAIPRATLISARPPAIQLLAPRARPVVPAPRAPVAAQWSLFGDIVPRVGPAPLVPALFAARDRFAPAPVAPAVGRSFGGLPPAVSPLFNRVDNASSLFQRPAPQTWSFGQVPAGAAAPATATTVAGTPAATATGTAPASTPLFSPAAASATPRPTFLRRLGPGEEFNFGAATGTDQPTPTRSVMASARPAPLFSTPSAPATATAAPPPAPVEVGRPLVKSSGVCFATPPPVDTNALFFAPAVPVPAPAVPSVSVPPAPQKPVFVWNLAPLGPALAGQERQPLPPKAESAPSLTEELVGQEKVPEAVQPAPPAPVSSEVPEQAVVAAPTEAVAAAAAPEPAPVFAVTVPALPAAVAVASAEVPAAAEGATEEPEAPPSATATATVALAEKAATPAARAASPAPINAPVPVPVNAAVTTVQELPPVEVKERKAKATKVSSSGWEDIFGLPDSPEPRTVRASELPAVVAAREAAREAMPQKAGKEKVRSEEPRRRVLTPFVVSDSIVRGQEAVRAAGLGERSAMVLAARQRAQADATRREEVARLRAERRRRCLAPAPARVPVVVEAPVTVSWSPRGQRSGRAHTWNPRTLVQILSAFVVVLVAGLWVFGISGQATALVSDLVPESLSAVMGTPVSATLYSVCEKVSVCGRGGDGDFGRASHAIPNGASSSSSICFSCGPELFLLSASAGEITGDAMEELVVSEPVSALFQDVFGELSCGLAVEEVPVLEVPELVPELVCWLYEAGMSIGTGEGIPVCELPAALTWGFPDYLLGLLLHGVRMV